jgi:Fe-S oxidoreductase
VARSLVRTLQAAKVNFAILGREETCNGDPARRCGNEYLFQMLAQENVETLSQYKFKRVVTTCAHCFNTFKNEYPAFGGQYDVYHHTEFINSLIESGQLKVEGKVEQTVTYHDPCYIGRHNGMYDAPRALLNNIPGLTVIEMPRNSRKSFCCGGGGGQSFYEVKDGEQKVGRKINDIRTKEALETGASAVAAACPYCTLMFEDGVKTHDATERFEVQDIVELVDRALTAK